MNQAWPTKRLADVCQILGGATPSKKNPKFYGGDIPWATVGDMNVEVITTTEEYITKAAVADCSTNVIPSGSIVMATRVGLGKVCVLGQDTAINQDLKGLTPKNPKELTNRWLYWWLKSMASYIQKAGTGATVQGVKMTFVEELEIPLPPLAEQKRIVALLDEAFAGIDAAKAKAEANQLGVGGLLKSHLQSTLSNRGSQWLDVKLEDVCGFQNGFAFKSTTFKAAGVPVIRISNIQDGKIDTDNRLVFVDPRDYRENLDRYRVVKGDLLIAMSGATTGKIGFNTESTVFYLNQRVGKFEPGEKLDKGFLYHFLSTKVEENLSISAGAAQPNLSTEQIKSFVLPLPPIDEQNRLVSAIEALSAETTKLSSLYVRKLQALVELKSSILSQAFSGELTA